MMEQERYTYDSAEVLRLFETGLDRLNPIRYDSKYQILLGSHVIDKLNRWDDVIRQQKSEPLTIVVCGEFKRGKSSLINALLGEDVVTTDVTTETITVNKVCWGPHSNEIILSGGKRLRLTDEELKSEKLRALLQQAKGSNQLVLKRPNEFLKHATIIDTPGLGDSLADFTEDVEQALRMADAVLYVFSVLYPLSIQEQYFIKTCLLSQKHTDTILIGNFADAVESAEELERVRSTISKRISDILPEAEPVLVSALDERSRQLGEKRPNPDMAEILEETFDTLRRKLKCLLEDKQEYVVPDRIHRLITAMLADVKMETDAIEEGLKLDEEQVKEKIKDGKAVKEARREEQQRIFEMIDRKCERYRADSVTWMDTLFSRLEADAGMLLNKVTTDDIKRFYTLFCVETLQEAFEKCSEHYLSAIHDELAGLSPVLTQKFSFESVNISPKFVFEVNNTTFTAGDRLVFMGSMASDFLGGGGLLSLVTNYVGGMMREREIEKKSPDYIASIKQQLSGLRTSTIPALAKTYKAIAEQAKDQIAAFFDNELRELDNAVEQASLISNRDASAKEETRAAVSCLLGILDNLRKTLSVSEE